MNRAERFAFPNRIADFFVQDDPDRGVDQVFLLFTAAAQHEAGNSHLLALNGFHEAAGWTRDLHLMLRLGQAHGIINGARVAALPGDDLAKLPKRGMIANEFV